MKNKKQKEEINVLIWIMLLVACIGTIGKHNLLNVTALADDWDRHAFLPENLNKQNPTVPEQIRIIAYREGFKWPDYLVRLAECESRFNPTAYNLNGGHSLDLGLFQWNMKYHPEIGVKCALDIECATVKVIEAINAGKQKMWVCDKYIK